MILAPATESGELGETPDRPHRLEISQQRGGTVAVTSHPPNRAVA